jgi:hypothetical protein
VPLAALLQRDFWFVVAYSVLLPILILFLLRLEGRDGYPGKVGMAFAYSGGLLPVFDLAENWLTARVLDAPGGAWLSSFDVFIGRLGSILVGMFALAKFAALALLLAACAYCLLGGLWKLVPQRRRPAPAA